MQRLQFRTGLKQSCGGTGLRNLPPTKLVRALTACCLIALLWAPAAPAASKKMPGWRVEQIDAGEGPTTILICDSGARITWKRHNYASCCAGPSFDCVMYNVKRNIQLTRPQASWAYGCPHISKDRSRLVHIAGVEEMWKGKKAFREKYSAYGGIALKNTVEMMYQQGSDRGQDPNKKEILYSRWIELKPQVATFLKDYYLYPDFKGVPLECLYRYPNGKSDRVLTTTSIEPVLIDPADLKPPPHLKPCTDTAKIMEDDLRVPNTRGVVEDLFGGKD